jgi:hypothetical protein
MNHCHHSSVVENLPQLLKNDGHEMAPQDVFLVIFGEDIIEHITFHSNAKGKTFKICY